MSMKVDKGVFDRFFSKVERVNGCWEWIGGSDYFGYGMFRFDNKSWRAHRFSWLMCFGEIPEGMFVLHKCDNPKCVNPGHLFLGSQADNMKDAAKKNRVGKFTDGEIADIRRRYSSGECTQTTLAWEYSVDQSHISYIVRNKIYIYIGRQDSETIRNQRQEF